MDEFDFQWRSPEGPVTLSWVGKIDVMPARVYAVAFISADEVLMVSATVTGDPGFYLPGGGVEDGETAEEALARELCEEADATIVALEALGSQRLVDGQGREEFHRVYWCRVTLAEQAFPRAESTMRHIVATADFLDTWEWGRRNPYSPGLFDLALEAERWYGLRAGEHGV